MPIELETLGEPIARASRPFQERYPAGELVSALRVVRWDAASNSVLHARPPEIEAMAPLGVAVTSANAGHYLTVKTRGELTDDSWDWIPGAWVLLGLEGALTQTAPALSWLVPIGVAISPVTIVVNIGQPITLG